MLQVCQMYTIVIQLFLIYKAMIWHHLQSLTLTKSTSVEITDKLVKQQNRCICLITSIYKVISILIVKIEMFILFLNLYLDLIIAWAVKKMAINRIIY